MEQNVKPARNGVARSVGEIKWTNEEVRKMFTDSNGRTYTAVFIDPDTGKPIFR